MKITITIEDIDDTDADIRIEFDPAVDGNVDMSDYPSTRTLGTILKAIQGNVK